MKKNIIKTLLIICAISCFSCSKKNSDKASNDDVANFVGPEIYPTIILGMEHEISDSYYPEIAIAFTNRSGEYLLYDNDADYADLCLDARIIGNLAHKVKKWPRNDEVVAMGAIKYWHDVQVPTFKKITEYAKEYFYGDKQKIPADIFEIIDRYYYDQKPLDVDFTLRDSSYDKKEYGTPFTVLSPNGYIGVTFCRAKDAWDKDSCSYDLDGNLLPDNALVCNASWL